MKESVSQEGQQEGHGDDMKESVGLEGHEEEHSDDHESGDGNGNKKDKRAEKRIDIITNLTMNSNRVIDSKFDDIIDLLVEHVVCQIFDDTYYQCIDNAVECINLAAQREAEREKRIELMVDITMEVVFKKLINDEVADALAKQRVTKKLFAKHSVSQIEMPLVAPVIVIVE